MVSKVHLEPNSFINVVLFSDPHQLMDYCCISKSCNEAINMLFINPWTKIKNDVNLAIKMVKVLPNLQMLRVDYLTAIQLPESVCDKIQRNKLTEKLGSSLHVELNGLNQSIQKLYIDPVDLPKLVSNIKSFPNLKFVECEKNIKEVDSKAVKKLVYFGIKIHFKFIIYGLDVYENLERIRERCGIHHVYYSFNAHYTIGRYLIVPRRVKAIDMHRCLCGDCRILNEIYLLTEAKTFIDYFKDNDMRPLQYLQKLKLRVSQPCSVYLPSSLTELTVSPAVTVKNWRFLRNLKGNPKFPPETGTASLDEKEDFEYVKINPYQAIREGKLSFFD